MPEGVFIHVCTQYFLWADYVPEVCPDALLVEIGWHKKEQLPLDGLECKAYSIGAYNMQHAHSVHCR